MYKILIADDKEIFRRKLKRIKYFTDNPEFVIAYETQNGQEALEILNKERVDIIITDIRMPIMDGMELLKEIRRQSLCACTVLLSEYTDFTYAKDGLTYGAFDYVIKPVTEEKIKDLLDRVRIFLDNENDKQIFSSSELKIARNLIINGDSKGIELFDKIIMQLEMNQKYSIAELQNILSDIITKIVRELFSQQPYLEAYVDMKRLKNMSTQLYTNLNMLRDECLGIVEMLARLICRFRLNTKNALVLNVKDYVLANIDNKINLKSIAEHFYVNRTYLSHLFKQETGIFFVDYITMVKMERSKIFLSKGNNKIYEVALAMGYEDTEYFSKVFKNYTRYNPIEYKKMKEAADQVLII